MNTLPSSIEESLKDAGFSATEILILRRLIEDRSLTLRQLAAKTGKSTGVLDQAMKKLLRRNVVTKDVVNDNPVFSLVSLEAITRAMEEDMEEKSEMLKRRFENFEAFVQSLTFEQARPDTEYFEGADGIKRCYCKLLGAGKEIIGYMPVPERSEDDPLEAFSSEFFRERRRRNIFSRIIAHDTPAGRKYQGRDPFEYRKTLLMSESECPFSFEKLIIGDSVVCINHQAERACIIHFPELAQTERALFETLWRQKSEIVAPSSPQEQATPSPMIPLKIRLYSELREFVTQPKNWVFLGLALLVSVGVGWGLKGYTEQLNFQRLRDQVRSIAATAALRFDVADVEALQGPEDIQKPEYARLVYQLNEVRRQNPDVTYAYIFRRGEKPDTLLFVADADSLNPGAQKDLNNDGVIDDADALNFPGDEYLLAGEKTFFEGFVRPVVDVDPYTDQWGTFISGAAPIYDAAGKAVAIAGFDIRIDRLDHLTDATALPVWAGFGLFVYLLIFRLASLYRGLGRDMMCVLRAKKIILCIALGLAAGALLTGILWTYNSGRNFALLQDRARSIAAAGAMQFAPQDIAALQVEADTRKPEWGRVVSQLESIRKASEGVLFVYIVRKDPATPENLLFVADSHSLDPYANTDDEPANDVDVDANGIINEVDILQWPGQMYPEPPGDLWKGFDQAVASKGFYEDAWGKFLSGYAPIRDAAGETVAVLAVDVVPHELSRLNLSTFLPFLLCALALSAGVIVVAARRDTPILRPLLALATQRRVLLAMCFGMMALFWMTFIGYVVVLDLKKEEMGRRLMAIAASSTNRFDPKDLDELHWARDMQKPAYQRVQQELLRIRQANPDVRYAYIHRIVAQEDGLYEFVADADSQYFLPWLQDQNADGMLDEEDEAVAPGVTYFATTENRAALEKASRTPTYEKNFTQDQWGIFIEGAAPIQKDNYILVFDAGAEDILALKNIVLPIMSVELFLLLCSFFLYSRHLQLSHSYITKNQAIGSST